MRPIGMCAAMMVAISVGGCATDPQQNRDSSAAPVDSTSVSPAQVQRDILDATADAKKLKMLQKSPAIRVVVRTFSSDPDLEADLGAHVRAALGRVGVFYVDVAPVAEVPDDIKSIDFAKLKDTKVDLLVYGRHVKNLGADQIEYRLFDNRGDRLGKQIDAQNWPKVPRKQMRLVANRISNRVFQNITGVNGSFDTHLAIVDESPGSGEGRASISVSEYDAKNSLVVFFTSGSLSDVAWSPDETHLVFANQSKDGYELSLQNVQSSRRKVLVTQEDPIGSVSFSPNGTAVAYSAIDATGGKSVGIVTLDNAQVLRLAAADTSGYDPVWMPDGDRLVFVSMKSGIAELYVMTVESGEVEQLTTDGLAKAEPDVSPDGTHVTYSVSAQTGDKLCSLEIRSGQSRCPVTMVGVRSPSYSPDGSMIAFTASDDGGRSIFLVSTFGDVLTKLNSSPSGYGSVAWSRNGR